MVLRDPGVILGILDIVSQDLEFEQLNNPNQVIQNVQVSICDGGGDILYVSPINNSIEDTISSIIDSETQRDCHIDD